MSEVSKPPEPSSLSLRDRAVNVVCAKRGCGKLVAQRLLRDAKDQVLQSIVAAADQVGGDQVVADLLPQPVRPEPTIPPSHQLPKDG